VSNTIYVGYRHENQSVDGDSPIRQKHKRNPRDPSGTNQAESQKIGLETLVRHNHLIAITDALFHVIGTEVAVPLAKLVPPICVAVAFPKPVAPTICVPLV
jgi:hypothetical protein